MPPDAVHDWYPIRALTPRHANRPVHLSGQGWVAVGRIMRDAASGRWIWAEWLPAIGRHVMLAPWRVWREDVPPHGREPCFWRPVEWAPWPEPLPVPIAGPVYHAPPPAPEPEAIEPETDGWPYPGLALGERVPPRSLQEAEARVLRGLRRMDLESEAGIVQRGYATDIPREFYVLMRRHQMAEDMAEARRLGHPLATEIGAVRAAWIPTRRDNGDWDYALDWWRQLPGWGRRLIQFRAANPPFSWRQIGEREGESHTQSRKRYRTAIEALFRIAAGSFVGASDTPPASRPEAPVTRPPVSKKESRR